MERKSNNSPDPYSDQLWPKNSWNFDFFLRKEKVLFTQKIVLFIDRPYFSTVISADNFVIFPFCLDIIPTSFLFLENCKNHYKIIKNQT
jgi:hypothetical protein